MANIQPFETRRQLAGEYAPVKLCRDPGVSAAGRGGTLATLLTFNPGRIHRQVAPGFKWLNVSHTSLFSFFLPLLAQVVNLR